MIETYDVKGSMRKSDEIFGLLNGLHERSLSGAQKKNELSLLLINIGDVFANLVRQGKVNEDTIESYESNITQFLGENKDKFFNHTWDDLDVAAKSTLESIYFAKEEVNQRNIAAQPVMDAESYTKSFRKLG